MTAGVIPATQPARTTRAVAATPGPDLTVVVPCYNERANLVPLVAVLECALDGIAWELLVVDDNSPDGTADEARRLGALDGRIRCLRRVGRRGLSSAVIEGALAAAGRYVAVMDGDLQHDETILPRMLALVRDGECALAVGSRHVGGGEEAGLSSNARRRLSRTGIRLAQAVLPSRLADPMSGFFLTERATFERLSPRLSASGFKILLDLVLTAPTPLRVIEVPFRFRPRNAGASKLDVLVLVQFAALLLDKATGGIIPTRFLAFMLVGALGIAVNAAALAAIHATGLSFGYAQTVATVIAIVSNFWLNNTITYRTHRLRGGALRRGFVVFMLVCGLGGAADIGVAHMLYEAHSGWNLSGAAGAVIAVVWNYAVSSTLVWRVR
jgi:dolichol-phosphate mannosyltransferase